MDFIPVLADNLLASIPSSISRIQKKKILVVDLLFFFFFLFFLFKFKRGPEPLRKISFEGRQGVHTELKVLASVKTLTNITFQQ